MKFDGAPTPLNTMTGTGSFVKRFMKTTVSLSGGAILIYKISLAILQQGNYYTKLMYPSIYSYCL
jgi:hypothetical protein